MSTTIYSPIPGFTEDWFGLVSQRALAALVESVVDVDGLIVEIGSWEGRSTVAIANAAHPRAVHAVDTWEGSPGEISADIAARRDVYAKFVANINHYTKGNAVWHRMGWRDFIPTISESIALCFIDAEHSYREVRDNIEAILPLMAAGGIVCGDDNHHPPIREALDDVFGIDDVDFEATLWIRRVTK